MGALGIGSGFDMSLDGVGVGGLDTLSAAFASEDEKLRRLESILKILNVSQRRDGYLHCANAPELTLRFSRRRAWLVKRA